MRERKTYSGRRREKEKETCRKREKREVKYESYTFNMRPEIEVKKEGGGGEAFVSSVYL